MTQNTLMTVGGGQLFGEGEFFKHEPRVCGAVAKEFSNAFILHSDDFLELLGEDEDHDEIYEQQLVEAEDRIDTTAKVEKMKKNLKSGGKMAQMMMLDDLGGGGTSLLGGGGNKDMGGGEKGDQVHMPDSVFRRSWDMGVLVVIFVNVIVVPTRISFFEEWDQSEHSEIVWLCLGLLLDSVMWVDMFFSFKRFATVSEGLLISDQSEFSQVYLKGRFKYDLISCFPFDSLCWIGGVKVIRIFALIRVTRFVALYR